MGNVSKLRKELRIIIRELGLFDRSPFDSGLTLLQAHILSYIISNINVSMKELSIQLNCDKGSISRIVNQMIKKGYLYIEKSDIDGRVKYVNPTELGIKSYRKAEDSIEGYFNSIDGLNEKELHNIVKSLNDLRLIITRDKIRSNRENIVFEEVNVRKYEECMDLVKSVFNKEQGIPLELMEIDESYNPLWFSIRVGEDIIGVSSYWIEDGKCHLGRIAIDIKYRSLGLGKMLVKKMLDEIFKSGVNLVYLEARDITVKIVVKLGGKIVGEPEYFYSDYVTPMVISKSDFMNYEVKVLQGGNYEQ